MSLQGPVLGPRKIENRSNNVFFNSCALVTLIKSTFVETKTFWKFCFQKWNDCWKPKQFRKQNSKTKWHLNYKMPVCIKHGKKTEANNITITLNDLENNFQKRNELWTTNASRHRGNVHGPQRILLHQRELVMAHPRDLPPWASPSVAFLQIWSGRYFRPL